MGVHSPPNYPMTELNDVFRKKKKKKNIFIYNGMTLTLKLLSQSSDSTKMPLLPAIRPPVVRIWIVTPHTRLHMKTSQLLMQIYYSIHSVKSP